MLRKFLLLLVALAGVLHAFSGRPLTHGPGEVAPSDPEQVSLTSTPELVRESWVLTPRASYTLEARVLARERYRFDGIADLSPLDLALGWGPMSDETVLQDIEISQSGRFYHWRVGEYPIPRRQIERHSANVHIIPSEPVVERQLARLRVGQVVGLSGYLVDAANRDGKRRVQTSLNRDDTGAGACELLWVEAVWVR